MTTCWICREVCKECISEEVQRELMEERKMVVVGIRVTKNGIRLVWGFPQDH
jgi:hypothetical protein